MFGYRCRIPQNFSVVDRCQLSGVRALEGFNAGCVCLSNITSTEDTVIHHNHNTFAGSRRITGNSDGVVKIGGTVGRKCIRRAHRTDQNDRLIALCREVQEVSGFFHRVGSVSDHKTVFLAAFSVDLLSKCQPNSIAHILRADLCNLVAGDIGNICKFRNCLH